MEKSLAKEQVQQLAFENDIEYAALRAIIDVESGGIGFAKDTGKIIIRFESVWFRRRSPLSPKSLWSNNKVEGQHNEWIAFNDAFQHDPKAAMESTSIGMMQVMGFHWKSLDFDSVDDMWNFAKQSEYNQVAIAIMFIKLTPKLYQALKNKDWPTVAYYYNGQGYKKFKYDTRLAEAYGKVKEH